MAEKDDTRITITVTDSKGVAQVYEGKSLSSAADHLKQNADKAKGAHIEMSKTIGGEARVFVRRGDGANETTAALEDAEAWLSEVSGNASKRSR